MHRYRLHDTIGDHLGLIEHPAPTSSRATTPDSQHTTCCCLSTTPPRLRDRDRLLGAVLVLGEPSEPVTRRLEGHKLTLVVAPGPPSDPSAALARLLAEGVTWGDARDWLPGLPESSVDLFFTSPPYADARS